ncbi:hypothetical protein LTR78_010138 [Recurvomyces mirabilis]|uniref:Heterokaryon incompatibility domain-containing protein n=1 Tax=Recurvomyces mirabilis TaxID=574656 RepID=A0AAE0WF63_9PEZI|nr:hypothetical protein LTR78_010138 [Recurvomyces mirabilis]KAK5149929.1 hypothetical protein LTS14_010534 [Recurvomyces mirabilis]
MRVLRAGTLDVIDYEEPPSQVASDYAILSHTWQDDEVLYEDVLSGRVATKQGYSKIYHACKQALADDLPYLWADTCCIDKRSSAELQETINSMYRWYSLAKVCYVYLADVAAGSGWEDQLASSRWFTRAWTLQELLAPRDVHFFDQNWILLGHLKDLVKQVSSITGIDVRLLTHKRGLHTYSIAQRMSWAAKRKATRIEDIAYSLLGIFDVNITMLYGEGPKAFRRLQEEIMRNSTDHSLFAWQPDDNQNGHPRGVLARSPAEYQHCGRLGPTNKPYYALELDHLPRLLKPRNYRIDPALFGSHARDVYLVRGLRALSLEEFKDLAPRLKTAKVALLSGDDFRTMDLLAPGQPWMTPAAKYTRG